MSHEKKLNYVVVYEDAKAKFNVAEFPHLMAVAAFCKKQKLTRYDYAIIEGELIKRATLNGLKDELDTVGDEVIPDNVDDFTVSPPDGMSVEDATSLIEGKTS